MTYEVYRYIFLGAAAASAVMALVSVFLFFKLQIPKVIGDLTGSNARKGVENIRRQNEESGDKSYKSSAVNLERGKLTDKITQSGRIIPRGTSPFGTGVITEKISTRGLQQEPAAETEVLDQTNVQNETTLLAADETSVLTPGMGDTAQLDAQPEWTPEPIQAGPVFEIEFEITYIHTNEVIA